MIDSMNNMAITRPRTLVGRIGTDYMARAPE